MRKHKHTVVVIIGHSEIAIPVEGHSPRIIQAVGTDATWVCSIGGETTLSIDAGGCTTATGIIEHTVVTGVSNVEATVIESDAYWVRKTISTDTSLVYYT